MSKGFYIEPTVIVTKDPKSVTMTEEIFGPVITVRVSLGCCIKADFVFRHTFTLMPSLTKRASWSTRQRHMP